MTNILIILWWQLQKETVSITRCNWYSSILALLSKVLGTLWKSLRIGSWTWWAGPIRSKLKILSKTLCEISTRMVWHTILLTIDILLLIWIGNGVTRPVCCLYNWRHWLEIRQVLSKAALKGMKIGAIPFNKVVFWSLTVLKCWVKRATWVEAIK